MAVAVITPPSDGKSKQVELYDSGTTCHISPYQSNFSTYIKLDLSDFLNAANQQHFPAIGTGTLVICAPNGNAQSSIILHDVLHAPAVGYTLVSLGALDRKGYRTSLGSSQLDLFAPEDKRIARIPQTQRSLYRVTHTRESVHAVEPISVMELHRRMGHIAPSSARTLVDNSLVQGIKLDPNSRKAPCDGCTFA